MSGSPVSTGGHPGSRVSARLRLRLWLLAVVVLLGLILPGIPVVAFQATPPLSACDLPPRPYEEIAALVATPAPPEPERSGLLPMGEPLRPEEQIQIEQTVHLFIACSNAGEPLRVYSLYSDHYLQRLLSGERPAFDAGRYDALATPMPAAAGSGADLVEITGGRRMADGRLGALVTIAFPSTPQPKTFFFTFLPDGDRLLIDDVLGELTFALP